MIACAFAALLVSSMSSIAPREPTDERPRIDLERFTLTWSDEFEGITLDTSKWDAPAMERQGASRWTPELVSVRDGHLHLAIRKSEDETFRYDCGAVRTRANYDVDQTKFQQQFGYFEVRCKLPENIRADYWAAFWLMAGDIRDHQTSSRLGTEIDIMETFNFAKEGKHKLAFHWGGYGPTLNSATLDCGPQPQITSDQFHTFGLAWDDTWYVAYLDGIEVGRTKLLNEGTRPDRVKSDGTAHAPAYLKLSCEAAPWAGQSHLWDETMPESDTFVIDYVRVYERKPD